MYVLCALNRILAVYIAFSLKLNLYRTTLDVKHTLDTTLRDRYGIQFFLGGGRAVNNNNPFSLSVLNNS